MHILFHHFLYLTILLLKISFFGHTSVDKHLHFTCFSVNICVVYTHTFMYVLYVQLYKACMCVYDFICLFT